jgi:Txe/YoeB family toxin of Txe-Axe toxin-antitoxin module
LLCPWIIRAQANSFNLYLLNTEKQRKYENFLNYTAIPWAAWQMQFTGNSLAENRLDFNQTGKSTNLSMLLSRQDKFISHEVDSGFEYLYDSSSLESELNPYINRTGFLGYGISAAPLDSMNLSGLVRGYYRDEQDRYATDRKIISQGLYHQFTGRASFGDEVNAISFRANWQQKKLDWEAYDQASTGFSTNLQRGDYLFSGTLNASFRRENIYLLNTPDSDGEYSFYTYSDRQTNQNMATDAFFNFPLSERLWCNLTDQYTRRIIKLNENQTKNNGDYNNVAEAKLNYDLQENLKLVFGGRHTYYLKALSFSKNSRIIETQYAASELLWEYSQDDSLTLNYTVELQKTSYPDADHQLDNDYLSKILKMGWMTYWKERIKLRNRFVYQERDEVFIDAWLSANNNQATSYSWQPEVNILLGDTFTIQQAYQIRADYDDYYYNSFNEIKDTFYRQLSASYHFIYDTSPLLSRLSDFAWSALPFRSRTDDAFRLDLNLAWERNETAAKDEGNYLINGKNEKKAVSLLLQKQYGIGVFQLQPKYTWGNWTEYNLLLSTFFQLNTNSYAEIGVNPIGESLDSLDWRISCTVNMLF